MSSINYIRETLFPELVPCAYILLSNVLRAFADSCLSTCQSLIIILYRSFTRHFIEKRIKQDGRLEFSYRHLP